MTEAEKQALAIYETLVATSKTRPMHFQTMEQMRGETAAWKATNPAFMELDHAEPPVLLAFLAQCFDWLKAEAHLGQDYTACNNVAEGIQVALTRAPKPLPGELVEQLFRQYYGSMGEMAHMFFPVRLLILSLTKDQVTNEIRAHLRKLHLRLAPSPTGKIEPDAQHFREQIAELMREEGEKQLDPGRGPWTQVVFDEIKTKEEIARAGWEGLLEHCRALEQAVPGAKWKKRSRELINILGEAEVFSALLRWLALGPTPGQPSEARSPIEDSPYQKGLVWCLGASNNRETAVAIADFGLACLRKVPLLGAVSQKVGFTCAQALGAMECGEAVAQLTRLRAKVKYTVARRLIEKSLRQTAERSGLTVEALEDMSVSNYGLDAEGEAKIDIGDARAIVRLGADGHAGVAWFDADNKLVKSAPSHVKKAFPKEVRAVPALAKELEEAFIAQRTRLESSYILPGAMPVAHWRQYFIEHPFLGFLGRRLIWVFRDAGGSEISGIWSGQGMTDSSGNPIDAGAAQSARLWHPLASDAAEVQRWRTHIFSQKIRQPFRQAFREFYEVTEGERKTKTYSNRFARVLMRQHQFASLCRARGWEYRLMSANFDGSNVPTKKFDPWNLRVEFYVDIPSDRDTSLLQSALGEQSGAGINLFIGSDQVRFYRDRREVGIEDVPAILYSEVMRDVDLFTVVSAVGADESRADQGDRGVGILSDRLDVRELSGIIGLRRETLALVLPHTPIQDRCTIHNTWLQVQGRLGTYRIEFAWGGASFVTETGIRRLAIPRKVLDAVSLDYSAIPMDMDYRTETILRKACVLADDWKIDSPDLIQQLMPPQY
ncbi:MAG TPA: DUF4132 domain-containing protein [Candidatus Acidoferrales bacterium]|nr:DUF4132 domain-containing protein [Candidatus Acidoferrales bacterium]